MGSAIYNELTGTGGGGTGGGGTVGGGSVTMKRGKYKFVLYNRKRKIL